MRFHRLLLSLTGLVLLSSGAASAAEPYLEFLNGLRERQYYDYALLYLDQIEKDAAAPAEIRQIVPYERAITLLQGSHILRNPETQSKQLDQAQAYLEQFVKANPNHAKAAQANTQRAEIFLGKARVAVYQSQSPSNESKKGEFQQQARALVKQARAIFQAAHDQHKKRWESFGSFIDQAAEPEKFEERRQAEIDYIKAQLDLALCSYEDAQSYEPGSRDYNDRLTKAAREFEQIHTKYRSQVGGLYARMWQGKCFEEQQELGRALGIYNELLGHPGGSPTMQQLQDQVLQFRLICLNHPQRKDHALVAKEGDAWLAATRNSIRRNRSTVGLGIRWEVAQAYEQLGLQRQRPEAERKRDLRTALTQAREINRYPGQYKDVSTFMIQRLSGALGMGEGDPKDFEGAIGLARHMVKQISQFNDDIDAAKKAKKSKDEIAKLQNDLENHLKETARILRLALGLATDETEMTQVNNARYFLAYISYLMDQTYEAAILGEFVGSRYTHDDSQMALDSAYIAMAAWQKAYNAVPKGQSRDFEMGQMLRICNLITANWPQSDRANDARMTLGRLYSQKKEPAEAAKWYSGIAESAAQYPEAQLAAGQAYWLAFLEASSLPEEERPSADTRQKWQDAAEKHLRTGIAKQQSQVPEKGTPPDDLIAAKVSLAQVLINKAEYDAAVKLLTGGPDPKAKEPHPVLQHIKVADETKRPEGGVKSREFAALAYQLLLRCYVGTQQIDKALETMNSLEAVIGGARGDDVLQVYVQLGEELQKEIESLKSAGNEKRLAELRASFDQFLNELYKKKDSMSFSALVWIAETYYSLGQGMSDDAQASEAYFQKAASTYEDILALAERDPEKVPADRLTAVKLRLVNCKRRQGDFDKAIELAADILKAMPRALDAQMEAAYVYQDWAASGQGDSYRHYVDAIEGPSEGPLKGVAWGWARTAFTLQRLIDAGVARGEQEDKYYESRYNTTLCRYLYAKAQSLSAKRDEELNKARTELEAFAAVSGEVDDQWWAKYDALYQDIQKDAGTIPQPLERATSYASTTDPAFRAASGAAAVDSDPVETVVAETQPAAPPPSESTTFILFGLMLLLGGGGVAAWMYFNVKSSRRRRQRYATASASGPGAPPATARRPGAAAKPRPKPGNGQSPAKKAPPADAAGAPPAAKPPKPSRPRPSA